MRINKKPFAICICLPNWVWRNKWNGCAIWPFVLYREYENKEGTIIHELEHIKQFTKEPLTFHIKYLYYLYKWGYRHNPYEIRARRARAIWERQNASR